MELNSADKKFVAALAAGLPVGTLADAQERYLQEPRARYFGPAGPVARPRSVQEVAQIIGHCAQARVGVVPYGGGTGLVGGQVKPDGPLPLILSLERMNKIRAVHPLENVMVAEAGCILADVQQAAEGAGRLFPLSLASEGSAQLGGNLATNAGGVNVLRYGNTRDLCVGVEAVLPSGEIWHGARRLRKDNTGYDLKNLLIGAEGTLGVITAASLKLSPRPANVGVAMMVVPTPAAALELLEAARDELGEVVSAFELIHRQGLMFLEDELPQVRLPFAVLPEWMVLIEVGLPKGRDADAALTGLFERAFGDGLVLDGLVAQSVAQQREFWQVRENIPEGNRLTGSISSHDISIPLDRIPEFISEAGGVVAALGDFRINCFGHLGDGNLHYNVFPPKGENRDTYGNMRDVVKRVVHDVVHSYDGSVSAEHGIGRLKVNDLQTYSDPAKLAAMMAIKSALDPQGIMNPGAIFLKT
jgi:FAD/FMN-containing dehydrogenase